MIDLDFQSMITVPLHYEKRLLDALTLFFTRGRRRHTTHDLALVEELAYRGAAAVENSRLYRDLLATNAKTIDTDHKKDAFIAMLDHELRNPLAPIMTTLDVIALRDDSSTKREHEIIRRQTK